MVDRKRIEGLYGCYFDVAGEPLASAVLVLCHCLTEAVDRSDRKIALGIRFGLFGNENSETASIDTAAARVGDGLEALADAISNARIKLPGR